MFILIKFCPCFLFLTSHVDPWYIWLGKASVGQVGTAYRYQQMAACHIVNHKFPVVFLL